MLYSDLYLKSQSKTPPVLFAVALVAVMGFFFAFTKIPQAPIRASKQQAINHTLVNVAPRDMGIYWETSDKTIGWVISGTSPTNLDTTTLDERDVDSSRTPSKYHFVHLTNLDENTTYYYKLVNNNEVIIASDNQPFQFTTLRNIPPLSTIEPAYGTVIKPNGEAATNAIVRLTYPGAYSLIAVAKLDGGWLITLPYLVDQKTQALIAPDENATINIEMLLDDQPKTTVTTSLHNASPLPQTIIFGKDYDLSGAQNVLQAATGEARLTPQNSFAVLFPKEKSIIPGKNPLIKGTALPGSDVSVKINTRPQLSFIVQTDNSGTWMMNKPVTIPPGDFTMTVSTTDKQGKLTTLTRLFSIAKSGEQVLAAASGPATLTPTAVPTPTLLPTATTAPIIATVTPQPTYILATATPSPPVTGVDPTLMLGSSIFLIIIGAGVMFFL